MLLFSSLFAIIYTSNPGSLCPYSRPSSFSPHSRTRTRVCPRASGARPGDPFSSIVPLALSFFFAGGERYSPTPSVCFLVHCSSPRNRTGSCPAIVLLAHPRDERTSMYVSAQPPFSTLSSLLSFFYLFYFTRAYFLHYSGVERTGRLSI